MQLQVLAPLHYLFKPRLEQAKLFEKILRSWVTLELDSFHEGSCELATHNAHCIHLEVRVANGDKVGDCLCIKLAPDAHKCLDLPLVDVRKSRLIPGAC